ncbi:NACHT domain-containing protein [Yinghuangia aomiensis]|uniref:NACHT domain-containing protein n=1 Tax=Yinghuangia aomiensis TaxID=676205 RepID=UPI0031EEB214
MSPRGGHAGTLGSGYVVGGRAVLTARHVAAAARDHGGEVDVRPLRGGSDAAPWRRARLVWSGDAYDAALLEADREAIPVPLPEVGWGSIDGAVPVPCTAVGFPRRAAGPRGRETDQLVGHVVPLAGHKSGELAVDVRGVGGGAGSWGGMSGAALFAGGRLVGVLAWRPPEYDGRRLFAEPVARLWTDAGFRAAAEQLGLTGESVPVGGDAAEWAQPSGPSRQAFVDAVTEGVRRAASPPRIPATWRTHLLTDVRERWVRDALESSFRGTVRLDVSARLRPDLVWNPWVEDDGWDDGDDSEGAPVDTGGPDATASLTAERMCRELLDPPDGRRLLILGAPGSGKTALVLALAERLLDAAYRDADAVVPLPLLLQNRRDPEVPLVDWVVDEIWQYYKVPRPESLEWLASGGLFLLLDGLDELPRPGRRRSRERIAEFLADPTYTRLGIAITCRDEEYGDGPALQVRHAVSLEPLDRATVATRLAEAEGDFGALREAVRDDELLAELLSTPLMLGIAAGALRGAPPQALPTGSAEERRAYLYRCYLERMLRRPRGLHPKVGRKRAPASIAAGRRLIPLARLLTARDEGVFYPDWITPEWTAAGYAVRSPWSTGAGRRTRTLAAIAIPLMLFALVAAPWFTAGGVLALGSEGGLLFAAVGTAAFALGRGFSVLSEPVWAHWVWSWRASAHGLLQALGLTVGVSLAAALTLTAYTDDNLQFWTAGLSVWACVALLTLVLDVYPEYPSKVRMLLVCAVGAATGGIVGSIDTPWTHAFDMDNLRKGAPGLGDYFTSAFGGVPDGFFDGTNVGAIAGLVGAYAGGWAGGVAFGFTFGLMGTVPGGLACGLAFALVRGLVPDRARPPDAPSAALRASGRVSLRLCAVFCAAAVGAVGAVAWQRGPVAPITAVALVSFTLLVGSGPARTWLTYWSTRWALAARGVLPWRLSRFLDDACERALLNRIGGGYRFLHNDFRDFVAGLDESDVRSDGRLASRASPAWASVLAADVPAQTADLGVLRGWWTASTMWRTLTRVAKAAVTSAPARRAGTALRRLTAAITWILARTARGILAGWLGSGLLGWQLGAENDMGARWPLACVVAGCTVELLCRLVLHLHRSGHRPPPRRRRGHPEGGFLLKAAPGEDPEGGLAGIRQPEGEEGAGHQFSSRPDRVWWRKLSLRRRTGQNTE